MAGLRLFLLGVLTCVALPALAADRIVTIGTASVTGVYYPAGGAICRLVNRERKTHGIRCFVESTGGSIDNLTSMRLGDLDFGIVQSDWQFHAMKGDGVFNESGPFKDLRSVFSLHNEAFTVVARKDSGIKTLDDLKGKRINMGNPGSGMRATMEEVMRIKHWTKEIFQQTYEMRVMEQGKAMCENKVDAIVFSGGNPNGAVQEVTGACPTTLVTVEGPEIEQFVKDNPFYALAVIPGGMYPGNPQDTKTFGVKATLVTSANVADDVVYQLTKALFEDFDNFKVLHPVFATLDPVQMVKEGNIAPIHPGAKRYYVERGWLEGSTVSKTDER